MNDKGGYNAFVRLSAHGFYLCPRWERFLKMRVEDVYQPTFLGKTHLSPVWMSNLDGKRFENVTWPVIADLLVSAR